MTTTTDTTAGPDEATRLHAAAQAIVADFDAHRRKRTPQAPPPAAPTADAAAPAATLIIAEDLLERLGRSAAALGELVYDYTMLRPDLAAVTRLAGKLEGVNLCLEIIRETIRCTAGEATSADAEWTPGSPSAASLAATTPVAAYATIIAAAAFRYGNTEARRLIQVCDLRSGALIGGHGA